MGYCDYLKNTLRPLGLYELDRGLSAAELACEGAAMDALDSTVTLTAADMFPLTASDEGIGVWELYMPYTGHFSDRERRRKCVNTFLRLASYDCSLSGLNAAIAACGIPAVVAETDTSCLVRVSISGLSGTELLLAKECIELILPCHLEIEYDQ